MAYRESLGFEIVPLTGGGRHPVVVLSQRLRANKVVCLISDRDLTWPRFRADALAPALS